MHNLLNQVINQLNQVILGKEHKVKLALACILAKGHLLIEDLPGMGKTTLAHGLAHCLGLSYQRIQFTSDLLPADVLGINIYQASTESFNFHQGAIFNQVLLADEINRASPKTQSALLEAMEEGQVSIDGTSHTLPTPFFVIATQNPQYHAGTYPLPESQLDRFMMRITMGFPPLSAERNMLAGKQISDLQKIANLLTSEQLLAMQTEVQKVHCSESIIDYVIALCHATRVDNFQGLPLSPRAAKALLNAAKAWAFIDNRDYLLPQDIQAVFQAVAEHRMQGENHELNHQTSSLSAQLLKQIEPTQLSLDDN